MSAKTLLAHPSLAPFLRPSVSNGIQREQALIRKWWHERHGARGLLVWEYYLEGRYVDAVWFPYVATGNGERSGRSAPKLHPLAGRRVELCEAKRQLDPELIGQAVVYRQFALRAGAIVDQVNVFSESASEAMLQVAAELELMATSLSSSSHDGGS